ncbi:Rap1a/Tai family immunity protein [Bordetella hinzii]|uniref:Rap1a/Tai family immunity protein n=1 Tax=Bordetella hinzii TaxID=103855 RepID=UPI0018AF7911
MKKLILSIATATLICTGLPTIAASSDLDNTGNQWLTNCQSQAPMSIGLCYGFISGVTNAYKLGSAFTYLKVVNKTRGVPKLNADEFLSAWCLPEKATAGQVRDVFVKFLRENPARRAESGDALLTQALESAFPCR